MTEQKRECPSCGIEYHGDGHELCCDCDLADRKMEDAEQYRQEVARSMMNNQCCNRCREEAGALMLRMILCPECGNKRCQKASDHRLECTGSNEPGQAGSVYK